MIENKALIIIGVIVLTVVGFAVIPPMVKKYSNRLYKSRNKSSDIDFDNLGPKIVKRTEKLETEDEE